MKKQTLVFLLVMVFLAVLAGCATVKRAELIEKRMGIQEVDLQNTREEMAREKGFREGLGKRIDGIENNFKAGLGATKKDLVNIASRVEKTEVSLNEVKTDLGTTKGWLQEVASKTEATLTELKSQVQKEYKDIRSYAIVLREIIAKREALHSYTGSEVEKIAVYFVGPFPLGQSKLDKDGKVSMAKTLAILKGKDYEILGVHGFADIIKFKGKTPEESEKLNQEISVSRANNIQARLKENGIDVADDKVLGFGGVVKFGTERDNRTVAIFGMPKPPTTPAPAPAPAPVPSPPTKP